MLGSNKVTGATLFHTSWELKRAGTEVIMHNVVLRIGEKSWYPPLNTVPKIKESKRPLNKLPFNAIKCLLEVKLEEYPRDILGCGLIWYAAN